jgi:hypothetical protein
MFHPWPASFILDSSIIRSHDGSYQVFDLPAATWRSWGQSGREDAESVMEYARAATAIWQRRRVTAAGARADTGRASGARDPHTAGSDHAARRAWALIY